MTNATDARFAGSIPQIYEEYLVPLLFQPYADDLAARCRDVHQGSLVELAAGTGAVTRALSRALPSTVRIVATDLNEAMLRVGQSVAGGAAVTWRQADAQKLPFEDASIDALVCQFGVMFFPDKVACYAEALRVLAPGARFIFNVWDSLQQNEVSDVLMRAVAGLFPDNPPAFFERTPFGYYDVALIEKELRAAGFGSVAIETVEKVTRAPSAEHVAVGLCQGTPLRGEIEARDPARLSEATRIAAEALSARFGPGAFDNRMSAHVVTAGR